MHSLLPKGVVGKTALIALHPGEVTLLGVAPADALLAARAAVAGAQRRDLGDLDLVYMSFTMAIATISLERCRLVRHGHYV